MKRLKELYVRLFRENTPEFHKWLRNRLTYLSGIAAGVLAFVDKWPNAFDPIVSKIAGYVLICGLFGAGVAQSAKKDTDQK